MHENLRLRLGTTLEERKAKILEIANETGRSQKLNHGRWRKSLISIIVRKLDAPKPLSGYINNLMNNMKHSELARIRIACIGEEAEAEFYTARGDEKRKGLFVELEPSPRMRKMAEDKEETDAERAARIQWSIELAIAGLPADSRTPEGLAKALDWKTETVTSYLFQKPKIAEKLTSG